MPENGITYVLTGPDGTRAVFNDDTDPDFVGLLDGEKGITGLLDGADVRENGMDLVEGDGGVHGAFYLGRRSGTLEGIIWPDPDMTAVNAREQKLKRATRALRADAVLSWTPTGGTTRRLLVRRKERVAITARRPKEFQVQLVSASPRIEATTESNQSITPGGAAGEIGIVSPIIHPVSSGIRYGSYRSEVLADTPLLYWRLGELAGTAAADASGNARNGTYVAAPTLGAAGAILGDTDTAADLDGAAQYVTSTYNPFTPGADRTFEAWVYRKSNATADAILGGEVAAGGTALLRLAAGSDTLNFYPQASAAASWAASGIGTGAWHHVVVAFNNAADQATLYVDGTNKGTVAMTDDFLASAQTFIVGAWRQVATYKDFGDLRVDEVAVYSGVLAGNRVVAHYQAGLQGPSGLGIVANLGDMEAVWRARITGPITNPRLRNNTTGQELRFTITLGAGEYLEVNADTHAITFGAALTPRYAALDFANSDWWLLQPGANDIRLLSAAYSAGAQLDLYFRHAYE